MRLSKAVSIFAGGGLGLFLHEEVVELVLLPFGAEETAVLGEGKLLPHVTHVLLTRVREAAFEQQVFV